MTTQAMSDIEAIVYDYLTRRGINFRFQTSLAGGFYELGGSVVDFLVEPNLAWRVMGEYYHRGVIPEGKDIIQKEMLTGLGYIVIDLWGDDIKDRLEQTMRLALQGQEMLV
uniref:DUF559 domain-containing protein n=1 Tax=viral metagenome TaxID=1070528 RepID=A0A6M3L3G1_9ZZZZ